jgi:hypothetical protein
LTFRLVTDFPVPAGFYLNKKSVLSLRWMYSRPGIDRQNARFELVLIVSLFGPGD